MNRALLVYGSATLATAAFWTLVIYLGWRALG